jgi:hypothetical protein
MRRLCENNLEIIPISYIKEMSLVNSFAHDGMHELHEGEHSLYNELGHLLPSINNTSKISKIIIM